jgi:hypothetical protein
MWTAVTGVSYAKYSAETCPYRAQPFECECWQNNDALDFGSYPGKHRVYIRVYMDTYTRTYMHTYIHIYIHGLRLLPR